MMPVKIISGGQTGADRGGLDFAIERGIEHGGWCPRGRRAEDGAVPKKYHLQETQSWNYLDRTERNVKESDGTVIFTMTEKLEGGSKRTAEFAKKHRKPWLHLHSEGGWGMNEELQQFMLKNKIKVLNVAGSRESTSPGAYGFTSKTLKDALASG